MGECACVYMCVRICILYEFTLYIHICIHVCVCTLSLSNCFTNHLLKLGSGGTLILAALSIAKFIYACIYF